MAVMEAPANAEGLPEADLSPLTSTSPPLLGGADGKGKVSGLYARNLVLKSTTIGRGHGMVGFGGGTYALDDVNTINCPATPAGNCVIEAFVTVQIGGTAANNRYGLCAAIDGKSFNPPNGCPYIGLVPTAGRFESGNFSFAQYNVKPGNHKLQSFVTTNKGGSMAGIFVKYHVYK